MGVLEVVDRVRRRVLLEVLDADSIPEPASPAARWPQWADPADEPVHLRILSLNAWGASLHPASPLVLY